uniref:Cyclin-dependent kinase inhibitor domain-containing protein n=1 Tax=Leersia perrieri TaxID=77586 RepID=A0A0D9XU56_9ORYZ
MGKYLRSSKQQSPSPAAVAVDASAYSYLTLRSGRRVPAPAPAGGGGGLRRRRRRAGGRRCGRNGECGVKSSPASQQRRCKAVDYSHRGELSSSPSSQRNSVVVDSAGDICGGERNVLDPNSCSGEVMEHDGEHNRVAAGRPSLSAPAQAEIEAFFAAAELADRRRFAETYNYDIVLDCPLQGRFEWEQVSTLTGRG